MSTRLLRFLAAAALVALAAGLVAGGGFSAGKKSAAPTVTMMVGGIDKQIYLPYQLAQNLGFYKKYGVNMQLSTEQSGGVGAETAMVSGQVDLAGAWYVHTIDFQQKGKNVVDVVQLSGAPQWLGGAYPAAGVLARGDWVASNQATVQKVVDALVATMHWINTHSAADIANALPPSFVSNGLTTKADYISALAQDKGQFLPDGMMPASGPATALAVDKLAGNV